MPFGAADPENTDVNCLKYFKNSSKCKHCTGGSVVEFSPATREARVRFPASARLIFFFPSKKQGTLSRAKNILFLNSKNVGA